MKKLLATLTTVAMLATTTAFAAPVANDAGYDAEDGTYSVAANLSEVSGQLTLLIIPEAAYLADEIEDADILYIDQGAYADGLFQSVGILGGTELEAGTYYAKIGGTGLDDIIVETFTIVEESQGVEVQLGDTTGEGEVGVGDINPIIQHILGAAVLSGQQAFQADTTGEGEIGVGDINPIIQHILGASSLGKGTYVAE